jgi:hypothetical protein
MSRATAGQGGKPLGSPLARLLARIDRNELPAAYEPAKHQPYVDRRMEGLSPKQKGRIGQLWKAKEKIDPNMPNRGASFVRILEYVADGETPPVENGTQRPGPRTDVSPRPAPKPVNRWKWSAETDEEGQARKAIPIDVAEGQTIFVVPFGVSEDDKPPVVLLPGSRFRARGRITTKHPIYLGISMNHPNGDFAGRFQTVCPADEFQNGEDFELTIELRDFQLDPSLTKMKHELPNDPSHFVVQALWFHTLERQAGLEIAELELIPPIEAGR